jgi:RsiW-degrading membrane proteinase PrsW (M82 family)
MDFAVFAELFSHDMNFAGIERIFFMRVSVSLLPVWAFLATLVWLDSFKLIRLRAILTSMSIGGVAAIACFFLNSFLGNWGQVEMRWYSRYGAPLLEECGKALYVVYLIKASRAGFMVDSAIHGFAIGAGFACVENIYYLQSLPDANLWLWIVRGFGTAIMHGGTTAILAIIAKNRADRNAAASFRAFLPALAVAVVIHSFFNHFFLPPLLLTILLLVALPALMVAVFQQSEKSTRHWLEVGFDTDRELLELITSERISASRLGVYLQTLKKSFPPEIMVDMLCYLRLRVELAIKAKGFLLMREAGLKPPPDPALKSMFEELNYLEKSIGKTGRLTISPFVSARSQDLWQLQMVAQTAHRAG